MGTLWESLTPSATSDVCVGLTGLGLRTKHGEGRGEGQTQNWAVGSQQTTRGTYVRWTLGLGAPVTGVQGRLLLGCRELRNQRGSDRPEGSVPAALPPRFRKDACTPAVAAVSMISNVPEASGRHQIDRPTWPKQVFRAPANPDAWTVLESDVNRSVRFSFGGNLDETWASASPRPPRARVTCVHAFARPRPLGTSRRPRP